jgi:biopolymer transport protein ExbB
LQPWAAVLDLFSGGGFYVILIFVCGLLLWTLIIDRYVYFLRRFPKEVEATVAVWNAREDKVSWCARQIRAAMISRLHVSMS